MRFLMTLLLIFSLLAGGCTWGRPAPPQEPAGPTPPTSPEAWIDYLTLEEKVGQLFWWGIPGPELSAEAEQLITAGKAGGFILFARQGTDPAGLKALTGRMQQLARGRERFTPGLVISLDHEGGRVQRFGEPWTVWPGAMAVGATRSEAYAEGMARAMAREMLSAGINMNLAPVADVNNNPANPVIGIRSFGEDPHLVGSLVTAFIKGTQAEGVSAVAKHFPGHGDTDRDSHFALPVVGHDRTRLEQIELAPFRRAIEAGVDAIMTAHVIFPAVATDERPATLSPKVLTGLLRQQLEFDGVIVTDAMEMKAIADHWGIEQGLIMALQAGADALLVTESFGRHAEFHSLIVRAVQEGRIPEERIDEAVRRNIMLKQKRGLLPGAAAASSTAAPPATAAIGSEAHRKLAAQIGAEALTLVQNRHLPLVLKPEQQVLAIGPADLARSIRAQHPNVEGVELDRRADASAIAEIRTRVRDAAVIIYAVYNAHKYPQHEALIRELIATRKPVIVIGMGEPYELTEIPAIETYIAAYGSQPSNLEGIGALLFGKSQPRGRLPVTIPDRYPRGHGLTY